MGVGWLLSVQGDARFFLEGAVEGGLPEGRTSFREKAEDAAQFCRTLLQPGDVVLIKGSRGVHLESVLDVLSSSPARKAMNTRVSTTDRSPK